MAREYDVTIKLEFPGIVSESEEAAREWVRKEVSRLWFQEWSDTPNVLALEAQQS